MYFINLFPQLFSISNKTCFFTATFHSTVHKRGKRNILERHKTAIQFKIKFQICKQLQVHMGSVIAICK